ncbi:MAG: glycosyltransferase [Lachnospiraceae bacterium]|nr:glycosyltransferase [Lachnospiraceae bacterium]
MGVKGFVKKAGELPRIIGYEAELKSMQGQYGEWLFHQEYDQKVREDAGRDVGMAFLDDRYFGGRPLMAIWEYFERHPKTMILYGDEDCKGKDGSVESPWFRPDWSPELLESMFYLGSLIAIRRTFLNAQLPDWKDRIGSFEVHRIGEGTEGDALSEDAPVVVFVNETPEAEYRRTMFSLCEKAGGWERGQKSISHLPGILYHCSKQENLKAFAQENTGCRRLEETMSKALLSVIIPTKDHPELLEHCLAALKNASQGLAYEVIVIDNGSAPENRAKIEKLPDIQYVYEPMEFNFSKLCNKGAELAKGELLLFLNDDVELLPESRLGEMMSLALRPGVGSVGLKLYYPDSKKIQHAGITNLPTGPVHKLLFLEDDEEYYFGRNRGWHDLLAVSAACVMLRKEVFYEAGAFDEELRVAYNDVALGFRLYEMGYRNVCVCDGYGYHHESLTRGSDENEEKRNRLMAEQKRLYQRFPELKGCDPFFSDFLGKHSTDTKIRPAYETMKNACQGILPQPMQEIPGIRTDACLKVEVEEDHGGELWGYAVVLGDDNACYERHLVFESETGERYVVKLHSQYRPDLVEKMPDQIHVALSGFWVYLEKGVLKPGKYQVGCFARRRIGSLKLFYQSGHVLYVKE